MRNNPLIIVKSLFRQRMPLKRDYFEELDRVDRLNISETTTNLPGSH